ncbi:MAG: calcium/sodium antiporter [Clostridia bacterium]|nr:calcium/sodium antiporter [Clostridia bacterium]
MILNILFLILGFALLIKGADILVDGASKIARKFKIPTIVIGLTIVAIGTSMPELMVSATSALEGHSDIAIGNIVGSNIANLFLILGICSIIKPLKFKKETKLIENPITIIVTLLFLFFCINQNNNTITKLEGTVLLILCGLFIIYNAIMAKKGNDFDNEEPAKENKNDNIFIAIIKVVIGIVALKFGGDFVVDSASKIAQMIGISEKIISLTIVAISTSLPELITSVTATKKGEVDMAIGNIIGSVIFNILLIIGTSAVIQPIIYSASYNWDFIVLIVGTILFALFPFIGPKDEMSREDGIIFLTIYILYMANMLITNL